MPHSLKDLCKFRFEQGQAALESAKMLFDQNDIRGSLNRSYYAIFYAARALLAINQLETRKHSGLVSTFIKEYVSTGIFDKEFSSIIKSAQKIRIESDYEDFYVLSREMAQTQIENAEKFVRKIEEYLVEKIGIILD
jgi:uncharacterized protein (UPF0332 family)